jgi:rhodanese-related sulfurtransferase
VIIAGFVSGDKDKNGFQEIAVDDLSNILRNESRDKHQIVDVRAPRELEREGMIESAINFELDHLRENLDKLDKNKPTIVYCARGLRGYVATMILENNGFKKLYNLGGGFNTWKKLGMEVKSYVTEDK